MAASISFTVVLPLLPVTATSGNVKRWRQAAASRPSASRVSSTRSADVMSGACLRVEHDADRTLPQRLCGEGAAVEFFAAQREEQIARLDACDCR